jgi:hypothetical protein
MIANRSYSSVFIEEGGWTRYKQTPRANSVNLANKHSKKLGTLIGSARADCPDHWHGPSGLRTVRRLILVLNTIPLNRWHGLRYHLSVYLGQSVEKPTLDMRSSVHALVGRPSAASSTITTENPG